MQTLRTSWCLLFFAVVLRVAKFAKGFFSNIAVLCGSFAGGILAAALGMMLFDKIREAAWFHIITRFYFCLPIFNPVMIATMTLVMIGVMIVSMGMFLALMVWAH